MYLLYLSLLLFIILFYFSYKDIQSSKSEKKDKSEKNVISEKKDISEKNVIYNIPFREPIYNEFPIYEIPNFLPNELCDKLNEYQRTNENIVSRTFGTYLTGDSTKNRKWIVNDPHIRISYKVFLPKELSDLIFPYIEKLMNISKEYIEPLKIVYYPTGGKFSAHYDVIPDDKSLMSWSRFMTMIIYINDDFEGGETEFPNVNKIVIPEKGKAVLFWVVRQTENGPEMLKDGIHQANIVRKGEKRIINVWFHNRLL